MVSINLHGSSVEIFKFQETGLVELCREVVDFVESGEAEQRGCVVEDAWFTENMDTISVVFPVKGD